MRTQAAQAAQAIRKHLKAINVPAKVTSKTYSMGNSVNVSVRDLPAATLQAVRDFCDQYQQGHFDGKTRDKKSTQQP